MRMNDLDRTDRAILNELQSDGRLSNIELARRINLSESACLRRVKMLEDRGIISGYAMIVNDKAVGLPGNVFVEITLTDQKQPTLDAFENEIKNIPEVMECYLTTGEYDYLLRLVVADASDYERVHHEHLTHLTGVARIKTLFTIRTVTKRTAIPV